jgi:glycosyltransferase involved in cell wall biosynthesis
VRGLGPAATNLGRRAKRSVRALSTLGRGSILRVSGAPRDGIRVFYGFSRIPGAGATAATGGIVKVQRMQARFPNRPWRFNVVYLVSSRLPPDVDAIVDLARRNGVPIVLNQNGVAYPGWHGPGWEATNAPIRRVLAAAAHVFYQSEFCKASADRFVATPAATWDVLPNAVDTRVFAPALTPPPEPLTLMLGGTQDTRYRLAVALDVLARVVGRCEARLLVTGRLRWSAEPVACAAEADRMVEESGVKGRVVFVGAHSQRDAPAVYRRAHVLLHTKYNDPSPGVVTEALASGLPVVYSRSGGVPELVGDAGVGVPAELCWERDIPPDAEAMAEAVLDVAKRLPEFSRAARQRAVERFDIDPWLDRHAAVFGGLLERRSPR